MKNYIKLIVFTLFLMASNLVSPAEEFHTRSMPEMARSPEEKKAVRLFHEKEISNLKEIRKQTEEKSGIIGTFGKNIRKTFNRIVFDDHRNIALAFNTDKVPTLTETDLTSFKKLSDKEKLEFLNEWFEKNKTVVNQKENTLNDRKKNISLQYDSEIKKLQNKIKELTTEQNNLKTRTGLTRFLLHGISAKDVPARLETINTELETLNNQLSQKQKTRDQDINKIDTEIKNNTESFKQLEGEFIIKFNSLLSDQNTILRYNQDTYMIELHHRNKDIKKPEDRTAAAKSFNDFWKKVGTSDFSGEPRDTQDKKAREKALDALEADFAKLVNTQKTKLNDKFPKNIDTEEQQKRNDIINEMQKELEAIKQQLISQKIDAKSAQDRANRVIEQADEKAQETIDQVKRKTENDSLFGKKSKKAEKANADEAAAVRKKFGLDDNDTDASKTKRPSVEVTHTESVDERLERFARKAEQEQAEKQARNNQEIQRLRPDIISGINKLDSIRINFSDKLSPEETNKIKELVMIKDNVWDEKDLEKLRSMQQKIETLNNEIEPKLPEAGKKDLSGPITFVAAPDETTTDGTSTPEKAKIDRLREELFEKIENLNFDIKLDNDVKLDEIKKELNSPNITFTSLQNLEEQINNLK